MTCGAYLGDLLGDKINPIELPQLYCTVLLISFKVSCHAEAFGFGVDRSDVVQLAAAACDNGNGGGGTSRLVLGQLQFLIIYMD